jgi:hypothetical protein
MDLCGETAGGLEMYTNFCAGILARWLTRDSDQAQDVVQEAYRRAYQFFDRFPDSIVIKVQVG